MKTIEDLKNQQFYHYFCEISAIPRESGNEKAISDYLIEFAKLQRLEYERDAANNIVIRKEASVSCENKPALILQCHMDMVCVADSDSIHDFCKDGMIPFEQDGFLTADRTSLGADNGVGMAYLLAVLESKTLRHPKLIGIFTTGEETGMTGMAALDASKINAERMINLDGEGEGLLFAGCAGGERFEIKIPFKREPINGTEKVKCYKLSLSGFSGGHSGIDINKGKANAIVLLARLLNVLIKKIKFQVCALEGGDKENAIPRDAFAFMCMSDDEARQASKEIREFKQQISLEFGNKEPSFSISLEEYISNNFSVGDAYARKKKTAFHPQSLAKILSAILLLPNGALSFRPELENALDASSNLGVLETDEERIILRGLARANLNSKMRDAVNRIYRLGQLLDGQVEIQNGYPPWEYREGSQLRENCCSVYREMYGKEMAVSVIHGGLECALMHAKRPEMDMVSIGPNIYNVHSPEEKAEIASLIRLWNYLFKLLSV